MFSLLHTSRSGMSLRLAALLALVLSASGRQTFAAENVASLIDEGLNQIVADEVTGRMSKFLEAYNITGVASVKVKGTFRSQTSDDLSRQITSSLDRRGIGIDENSNVHLEGVLVLTQTKEETIVVMECTLTETDRGELCTVRVRKVLPVRSGS